MSSDGSGPDRPVDRGLEPEGALEWAPDDCYERDYLPREDWEQLSLFDPPEE